jgi:hypothetical protein
MKNFDFAELPKALLTPDIVAMLTSIHEHKGKQALFIEAHADALTTLVEMLMTSSSGTPPSPARKLTLKREFMLHSA